MNILTLEPNISPSQSDPSCRRSPTPIVRSHRGNPNHGWSATPFRMVSFSLSSSSSLVLVTAPVHVWRRQSASPLQGKLLLRKSQFFPSLRGRSPGTVCMSIKHIQCKYCLESTNSIFWWLGRSHFKQNQENVVFFFPFGRLPFPSYFPWLFKLDHKEEMRLCDWKDPPPPLNSHSFPYY